MAPLSEKAKGKQRMVESDELEPLDLGLGSTSSMAGQILPAPTPPGRELVIRFTEGFPDLTLRIEGKDSVRDVKQMIRQQRTDLWDRRLRLIYSGRLLTDGTFLYEWLESLETKQRNAVASNSTKTRSKSKVPTQSQAQANRSATNTDAEDEDDNESTALLEDSKRATKAAATTWIHCSVGPKMEPGEQEQERGNSTKGEIVPLRGFDRLAGLGFSPDDIRSVRAQFHRSSAANYLDGELDFTSDEEYLEHARALEDQWIESLDPHNPISSTSLVSGGGESSADSASGFTNGILVGFFFPIIPFFFISRVGTAVFWNDGREHDVGKSVVFSRRMQMGLVIGFALNMLFGWWRLMLDSS